ncbi:MAG: hypothetical protein CL930_11910 [Deltaproteobacteria bacterium]|nr:hypothetical protein [Deltaproteobacteria bacterium]
MTRTATMIIPFIFTIACKKEEPVEEGHETCVALDDRGIKSRLDNLVSSDDEIFALEGHCLEATSSINYGDVWGVRFAPTAPEGESPDFHIQMFFIPPNTDQTLMAWVPERLSKAECLDVPEGAFCGHVDDDTYDPNIDDVDLRGKTGTLDLEITKSASDSHHRYEGDLEWSVWAVDSNVSPEIYEAPAIGLSGTFHWQNPDGAF